MWCARAWACRHPAPARQPPPGGRGRRGCRKPRTHMANTATRMALEEGRDGRPRAERLEVRSGIGQVDEHRGHPVRGLRRGPDPALPRRSRYCAVAAVRSGPRPRVLGDRSWRRLHCVEQAVERVATQSGDWHSMIGRLSRTSRSARRMALGVAWRIARRRAPRHRRGRRWILIAVRTTSARPGSRSRSTAPKWTAADPLASRRSCRRPVRPARCRGS